MKKLLAILVSLLMMPLAVATVTETDGIGIDFETEEFEPLIWMCDHRVVIDDPVQPGRVDGDDICSQKDEFEPFDLDVCDAECCLVWDSTCDLSLPLPPEGVIPGPGDRACWSETYCDTVEPDVPPGNMDYYKRGEHCCQLDPTIQGCSAPVGCLDSMGCFLKGDELIERHNNYAFEGEKIEWKVLVMDKNKIEQIEEVVGTIGSVQGPGNDIEVECLELQGYGEEVGIMEECNARIDQEEITEFDNQIMAYYECTLTVETPDSMYDEHWITVEAIDAGGLSAIMDENEYWFLNPLIALAIDGDVDFGIVRPGTISYSETILVGNDADPGSGVLLDMFISGTDFYDPASQGSRCVITNRLKLGDNYAVAANNADTSSDPSDNECNIGFTDTDDHLCYYATNGAYGTQNDPRNDDEGYAPIVYGDAFTRDFYNDAEIIQDGRAGVWWHGNWLTPEAEMAITFKLGLPVPCVGDFTDGDIYFWGEAI